MSIDVEAKAAEILDVGDRRFRRDDYEARMDFFAQELEKLDPNARAALFDEILEQDSGAPQSWLTVKRLNNLVGEGRITSQERDAIFDAFGAAYVNGDIELSDALQFTGMFQSGVANDMGLQPQSVDRLNVLLDTLTGSNSPNSSAFLEKFAADVLSQRVFSDGQQIYNSWEQSAYAGVLLNALEQSGGTAAVDSVMSQLSDGQRSELRDAVAAGGGIFHVSPYFKDSGLRDPMVILIDATSQHGSEAEVLELVQYVNANSSGNILENHFFDSDNKPIPQRAEALSELFLTHSDTILDSLTIADPAQTPGSTNDRSTVVGSNLAALSNLVRLTGLNPDNPQAAEVMARIGDFTSDNIRLGNMPEGTDVNGDGLVDGKDIAAIDAGNGRAAMIGAVMQDAVSSGYADLREDQAAREAFLGFIIDVAFSAIPAGGKLAGDAISERVSDALGGLSEGTRKQIAESLSSIPEELLTNAQGGLTDTAKQAIIDALPDDYAYLEDIKLESNTFIEDSILSASDRDYQITESMSDYRDYIDRSR
ncbi:MAG TPA: hypothetical protein PLF73_01155 [Luteimonas sp.]|nr:hypothetical protein [Luteimonas sp.]HRO26447.1 hypothetical protein [Luteimonas sp.]